MYTLSVTVNDDAPIIAGGADLHTLNAMVTCAIDRSAHWITLTLGGATLPVPGGDASHLRWFDEQVLQVGDTVTFALHDDVLPDPPSLRLQSATREDSERFIFENCKRAYFALRAQYDTLP